MNQYEKNIYSQNGEDGVIEEIIQRLEMNPGVCCEFGAWNGWNLSNTFNLVKYKNWKAVYIEGDDDKYNELMATCQSMPSIIPVHAMVEPYGEKSLASLLKSVDCNHIDILSIDVDGTDYYIWEEFTEYQPAIVIIEISSGMGADTEYVNPTYGSSFASMLSLGNQKGYDLVCHTGNMIFVRKDLTQGKFENINSKTLFKNEI